jgi:hypothetical protein
MNLIDAWKKYEGRTRLVNSAGDEILIGEEFKGCSPSSLGFIGWLRCLSFSFILDDTWEKKKDKVDVIKHIDTTITTAYPGKTIKVTYEWEE